jgi:3',5'-nucleoside bisphosphate phosphatase
VKIDLHTHSTASDGSLSPAELVRAAVEHGVDVLALTDHDTTSGLAEAEAEAARLGLHLVPGIELSVCEGDGRLQCHVLGYGFDRGARALADCTAQLRSARITRLGEIAERLRRVGIETDLLTDAALAGDGTLGRPHVAQQLVERGYCQTPQEAFDRWIGRGKPAFVPAPDFSAKAAIDVVHEAGGVAVLAHPMRSTGIDRPGGAAAFVGAFAALGLDGLEVQHPSQNPAQRRKLGRIARDLGLLQTGGSDFHGAAQPDLVLGRGRGNVRVERAQWDALLAAIERRRTARIAAS